MFQLETTNIKFEHLVICCKGCWGQKSPKVIQGHLGSLRVKNKIIAIPHILLNYNKTCSTLCSHIIKRNLLIISYFIFLVSMVTCFWPKHNKCSKMGSKWQIFVNLRNTITIFSDLKCIMLIKEIPRNGVIWCIEIASNDL